MSSDVLASGRLRDLLGQTECQASWVPLSLTPGSPAYLGALVMPDRANPDDAYLASPNTGFTVYDSYGGDRWGEDGATSAGRLSGRRSPRWTTRDAGMQAGRRSTASHSPCPPLTP